MVRRGPFPVGLNAFEATQRFTKSAAQFVTDTPAVQAVLFACGYVPGFVATICGGISVAAYAMQERWGEAGAAAAGMVAGSVAAAAVKMTVKAVAVAAVRPIVSVSTRASIRSAREATATAYAARTRYQTAGVSGVIGPAVGCIEAISETDETCS